MTELRSFFVSDDEKNPGLVVMLNVHLNQRIAEQIEARVKQIPAGPEGPEGHLPAVKPYVHGGVHYRGDVCTLCGFAVSGPA